MSEEQPSAEAARAIEALVEEHGARLYRLGLRICDTPEDAEEMVQETFLNALRGWSGFEGRAKPSTWLYTIAQRVCLRRHRKRAGEPDEIEALEELLPEPGEPVGRVADPEDEELRREARETVARGLRELSPAFRMPLVLVDIAELSIAETAEVLGLPPATVKTRVHRARLKLRRALDERLPRPERPASAPGEAAATRDPVCLAMLQAKLDALDRGVELPYPASAICDRCRSVFSVLDLGRDACRDIGRGDLPPELRRRLDALVA